MTAQTANLDQESVPDLLPNLRDLGGLCTDGGGRTNHGVLQRSAAPLAGDRRPTLAHWPPSVVVDLRGADELGGLAHPLAAAGTEVRALPLLAQAVRTEDGAALALAEMLDLATAYRGMLTSGEKLATILGWAARADGPVLVHCAAGKDRTGVTVAVLLRAAGVARSEIAADYLRTGPELPAILARNTVGSLEQIDPTHVQRLMGVPLDAITSVLDEVDGAPGGARGWLRARGVSDEQLDAWRMRLLG